MLLYEYMFRPHELVTPDHSGQQEEKCGDALDHGASTICQNRIRQQCDLVHVPNHVVRYEQACTCRRKKNK